MKKVVLVILVLMLCVTLLTGCNNTSPQPEGNLTKVVVSEFRGIGWSSTYLAHQLGYFEEEGLDVEFAIYKDGPIAFQGMHAGDSQFCLLSAEPVMRAYDEGIESYFVLTNTQNRTYGFASKGEIKDVSDLKGKVIFAGMPGSAPYSFVASILNEAGLDPMNDVTYVNLEYGASIAAFAQGGVDAIFFDVYNKKDLIAAVPDVNILLDSTNPATHEKLYGSQFAQTTIVTTTKKFADENPETVQKYVNASVKALDWLSKHSSAEAAEILAPMFEGMTKEVLADKLDTIKSSFSPTGEIYEEGYGTVETFCLEQGIIKQPIGFKNIVKTEFVKNALEKL
jgi:NitT/TauT family transport system substrate-binding protein